HPYGVALTNDGKFCYVTSFLRANGAVLVVDMTTQQVIANIPVGNFPAKVAITRDQTQAWITSKFSDSITVVDVLTNTRVTTIPGVTNGWGIAFNPTGTRAYVAASDDSGGGLYVIDTASYQ